TVGVDLAALLPEVGVGDLGESRPQELWRKAEAIRDVRWHLVGHLQRNKVERTLPLVEAIHSVDSLRLLDEMEQTALRLGRSPIALLEVNESREAAKHGFAPEAVLGLVERLKGYRQVKISGLMTMAALADVPEQARPTFAELRRLRERLRQAWGDPDALPHLS